MGSRPPPIDSALLRRVEPDFRSGARRSWKIERLVGPAAARPKHVLEVADAEGVATAFPTGARRMGEPVLSLDRRGELLVALRAREAAARAFHGRGGNRGRPGSPRWQIRIQSAVVEGPATLLERAEGSEFKLDLRTCTPESDPDD